MKLLIKWYILSALFLAAQVLQPQLQAVTPVNPQPGQNLWHIAASIGTELDQVAQSLIDNCCATTFTALQQIDNDVLTVSSKVDALSNLITTDFNDTFTALNGCCTNIMSNLTGLSGIVAADFNGTFTALADIRGEEFIIESKLDACCATLNSKIDSIAGASTDLSSVFTALQQIDNDVLTVSSKIDSCCTTLNSKLDAFTNIINLDFNGTFTTLTAINNLITNDFNGTFTALAAGFACGATPLYQSNVTNGAIVLTTNCASYCLAQCITGSIIIAASNVTVDLNDYSLLGTFSVLGSTANVTIQNGNILPPVPASSLDVATASVFIDASAQVTAIKNCRIECASSTINTPNGRNGIDNSGINTLIDNCFVQAGNGLSGGSPGVGIYNEGANVQIKDSTIMQSTSSNAQFLLLATNINNATVQPFYAPSGTFKPAISVNSPYDIAITPDGKTAYVSTLDSDNFLLTIINIATNAVTGTVDVGMPPGPLAITPDGKTLYFGSLTTNFIGVVDIASNTLITTIGIGAAPRSLAITPNGETLYATTNSNVVITIDVATNTMGTTITGFNNTQGIAITSDGTTAYVANYGGNTVTPINIATNTIGTPIGVTSPQLISITPDGKTGYVMSGSVAANTITPFTIATGTLGTPITGFGNIADSVVTPDNKTLYVTDSVSSTVVPIDVATNTVGTPISGFSGPSQLALAPLVGGTGIIQTESNGEIINTIVLNQGTVPALYGANGIMLSSNASSNILKDCTVNNAYVGFSLVSTSTVQMNGCIAQSCVTSGFSINGANDIRMQNCLAQACQGDGFIGANSCTNVTAEHCTAINNTLNGFNFSSAGACCSVGDSFAISNGGYGYLGNGTNIMFYNNFANCNGTNFDSYSASSVIGGCAQTPLSQFSAVNGSIILTTTGASYCLSQSITATIIIAASDITLDLNEHMLVGTIEVSDSAVNAIVRNGSVMPGSPVSSADAAMPAIRVDPLTNYTLLEDLYIVCSNTNPPLGVNGRDGIDTFGNNTIIQRCVIQTGTGNAGAANAAGGSGGTGIVSAGANAQLLDCTITTGGGGGGGTSSTTTTAGAGGNGGSGINSTGANVQITNCMILPGAGGKGGDNTNSTGAGIGGAGGAAGNGIVSTSTPAQIEDCSIITASGGWGGNVALASSTTNITGAGGAGGTCISATGSRTIITNCYLEAGPGGRNGVMTGAGVAYPGNGGNAGAGISFPSATTYGGAIEGCVIRVNAGGTAEATATLAPSSVVALGGIGGDGIISAANIDLISNCNIAGANGFVFNAGGNSFGFSAPGARAGSGINLLAGGNTNVIQNCTISLLGAGGSNTSAASASGTGSSDGGAGGNGITIAAPVGIIRDCSILFLANGGAGSSGGGSSTSTGGAGGSGITSTSTIGVISNCVIDKMGLGGGASGVSQPTTTRGGAGGAGIFSSATVGIIENCKISNTGNGGVASGSSGANIGGNGGAGIQLTFPGNSVRQIAHTIRNCTIYYTGSGGNATGSGTATGGNGGDGISTGAYPLIIDCYISSLGEGGNATSSSTTNAGSGGNGITFLEGFSTVKNCVVHGTSSAGTGGGSGVGGNGIVGVSGISCTRCAVSLCAGSGFNFSTAGERCTVERCVATDCSGNGFSGSTVANNAVFYLNEASKNGTNFSGLGSNSGGGGSATGTPANAVTINYGANLSAT